MNRMHPYGKSVTVIVPKSVLRRRVGPFRLDAEPPAAVEEIMDPNDERDVGRKPSVPRFEDLRKTLVAYRAREEAGEEEMKDFFISIDFKDVHFSVFNGKNIE